jgi:hypothetical protein
MTGDDKVLTHHACLEEMEGRWIAHVPALLGCFHSSDRQDEALAGLPAAISRYFAWRNEHGDQLSASSDRGNIAVDEVHRAWMSAPDNEVNAFFAADATPLTAEDASLALRLLEWSRADLLAGVVNLTLTQMERILPGESWSARGILLHVGVAEWWYADQIGHKYPRQSVPDDPMERLGMTREQLRSAILQLVGVSRYVEENGELWSPRKVIRRATWHERDHIQQLLNMVGRLKED